MITTAKNNRFTIKPRLVSNTDTLIFNISNNYNSKEVILIESYIGDKFSGHLIIRPLFSKSRPAERQAVLFSNLVYRNIKEAKSLIREGLMCAWEMGYHVAFARDNGPVYSKSGFSSSDESEIKLHFMHPGLFFSELSWDGMNKLSNDLIFPAANTNYSIN